MSEVDLAHGKLDAGGPARTCLCEWQIWRDSKRLAPRPGDRKAVESCRCEWRGKKGRGRDGQGEVDSVVLNYIYGGLRVIG